MAQYNPERGPWVGGQTGPTVDERIAYDAAIDYARTLGAEHGRNAAEWYVQYALADPAFGPRAILTGIEDGDPEVLDIFPAPDLSGEWADTLTGPQLVEDALYAAGLASDDDADENAETAGAMFSDVCDAYETAFSDAVTDAIETAARAVLA